MSQLVIKEINSKKEIKAFVMFPWQVYKHDKNWVPPLIGETIKLLDREQSPFFEFGEAAYFMAYRDNRPVGRVTAQVNHRHNEFKQVKEGFFGFYECLEDQEAATGLMQAAEKWVKAKGMTKIVGPESFTIYDEVCFLVDGGSGDPPWPVVMTTHTPRYYMDQMEQAGYEKEIDWYAYMLYKDQMNIKSVYLNMKERLFKRYGYTFRNLDMSRLDEEAAKVMKIFNEGWEENWGHVPLTDKQFEFMKAALKHIADPRICWMVEDSNNNNDIVGCTVYLPDINPSIKKMNGRFFPFGFLHFLGAKKKATGIRGFLTGVAKPYRNKGVDVALIVETFKNAMQAGYGWAECSLMVETNHRILEPIKKWGGKHSKTWRLYSKEL